MANISKDKKYSFTKALGLGISVLCLGLLVVSVYALTTANNFQSQLRTCKSESKKLSEQLALSQEEVKQQQISRANSRSSRGTVKNAGIASSKKTKRFGVNKQNPIYNDVQQSGFVFVGLKFEKRQQRIVGRLIDANAETEMETAINLYESVRFGSYLVSLVDIDSKGNFQLVVRKN